MTSHLVDIYLCIYTGFPAKGACVLGVYGYLQELTVRHDIGFKKGNAQLVRYINKVQK
jgi:hypothetical protein